MAKSSLQSLFFWDCFTSLLMAYLLAETYVELDISFESYHDEDVGYKVVIINQRENPACIETMANELKTEYLEPFPFNRYRINHTLTIERSTLLNYDVSSICVRVTPFKDNCSDCSNFTQIIPYIKINAYGDPDCADWNIQCLDRLQEYNESSNSWNLPLECDILTPHDKCKDIYEYEVRLKKLVSPTEGCDSFAPDSPENQLSPRIIGIMFLNCNLHPPSRCKRHTTVTHILDVKPSLLPYIEDPIEENYTWISISVVCVVVLCLVIGGILYYRRVRRLQQSSFANDRNLSLELTGASFLNTVISNRVRKSKREVTILYTQETPEIIDAIIAMVHFLRTCCDVVIRLDIEEEAIVRKNPFAWYNRGDLFILVETAGAVLREQACLDNKVIYHVDEDALDSYFLHSFVRIVNNPESIVDYSKYLVVHFSFTPTNVSFKTVALTKRYEIVRHLAQLRHFLNKGKDLIPSTQNLLRFSEQFEESTEYKALIVAIDGATRFGQDLLVQCVPPEPLRASKQQTCGRSIAIDLFVLENNFDTCSFGETSLFVKINTTNVSLENSKVLFTKLTPGYYCYHVRPLHCKTDCAHYSEVINLQKFDPLRDPKVEQSSIGQSRQMSYIMGAIISVTVVAGLIIGLFLRQLKKRRLEATPTWEFKPIDSPHDVSIENPPQKVREVTILYTQESPEILNCIVALVQFIRKCCDVIVRIDIDDETAVRMNPVAWYGRGDLFILVETAGAVYREKACLDKKEIYHIDEDSLDSYFLHSFMRIINNPDSVIDYSKYVVVRFSYTPRNVTFKTVALNKRYVISQHLAQLCHFLTHGKDLTPTTENLLKFVKKWEGTSHYQNLSLAIEQASSFVNQNPNYVQSVLKER